jgi:hypothetical protein
MSRDGVKGVAGRESEELSDKVDQLEMGDRTGGRAGGRSAMEWRKSKESLIRVHSPFVVFLIILPAICWVHMSHMVWPLRVVEGQVSDTVLGGGQIAMGAGEGSITCDDIT